MKKPLMLVPPAQAEALYDAALHNARHGMISASKYSEQSSQPWEAREWDEDDTPLRPEAHYIPSSRAAVSAHD